jgi:hypothetical protein
MDHPRPSSLIGRSYIYCGSLYPGRSVGLSEDKGREEKEQRNKVSLAFWGAHLLVPPIRKRRKPPQGDTSHTPPATTTAESEYRRSVYSTHGKASDRQIGGSFPKSLEFVSPRSINEAPQRVVEEGLYTLRLLWRQALSCDGLR